jgi:hypothetical protein
VTPLLPVADPFSFARRARESGVDSLWVGRLRLLKDDPFYDLLARNHWLKALDPDYAEEIREALREAVPAARKSIRRDTHKEEHPPIERQIRPRYQTLQPAQPCLFEEL